MNPLQENAPDDATDDEQSECAEGGEGAGQNCEHFCAETPDFEPELQALADAWDTLPEAVREAILALAKKTRK